MAFPELVSQPSGITSKSDRPPPHYTSVPRRPLSPIVGAYFPRDMAPEIFEPLADDRCGGHDRAGLDPSGLLGAFERQSVDRRIRRANDALGTTDIDLRMQGVALTQVSSALFERVRISAARRQKSGTYQYEKLTADPSVVPLYAFYNHQEVVKIARRRERAARATGRPLRLRAGRGPRRYTGAGNRP